jgi:CRISPR-associated endoribonuclease Cas6
MALLPRSPGKVEPPAPLHLHALVSTLLSESDEEHRANEKAWSVAPPAIRGERLYLLLNWLPDDVPPDFARLRADGVRLGRRYYAVEEISMRQVPFGMLGMDPAPRLEMSFLTPTWFTRGAGEYALPDPYLVFRRLSDRWGVVCPDEEQLDDDSLRETLETVRITRFDGRSAPFEAGRGRKTGFAGWARYQLPAAASAEACHTLTSLGRFAAFAGVGAMTTYGAGHVEVEVLQGVRPRAGR